MTEYVSIINPKSDLTDPEQKKQLFEQYQRFLNAIAKVTSNRKNTKYNITLNSVIISTVGAVGAGYISSGKKLPVVATLMINGVGSILSWVSILSPYKTVNHENDCIIKELETYFPSSLYNRFNQLVAAEGTLGIRIRVFWLEKNALSPTLF